MDRAIRQLSLLPVTGRIEVKTLVCAGARVESLELEAREARGMDRGRYIKRVSRGTRAVLRTYPCVSCRNHLARENEISVNPRPREPRFVRGPSVRFRPSRAPQMQAEPRPSLTPSLVVPKNTCVETRALECPPARPITRESSIHPLGDESPKRGTHFFWKPLFPASEPQNAKPRGVVFCLPSPRSHGRALGS